MKVGDGSKTFSQLPFTDEPIYQSLAAHVQDTGAHVPLVDETVYTTAGAANAYTVTIPNLQLGKTYLLRFHAATSSATVNVNPNSLGNVRLYAYGTTGPASGLISANQIAKVLYSDISGTPAFYFLNYITISSVTSSTYTNYGVYGGYTYLGAVGGRRDKWLSIGTITISYNATYSIGHSGQVIIGLEEGRRDPPSLTADTLERLRVVIGYTVKSATTTSLFTGELPSIDIAVDGVMNET